LTSHSHSHGAGGGERWAEHALARLETAGFRRGGARRAVIEVLAAEPCALSALDIDERLRGRDRRVGRASVYRALEQLGELDLVHKLDLGSETARYERIDPGGDHHHHMVCDRCGKVLPFEDRELEVAVTKVTGGAGFEVRDHEIVLHGACDACR
jgi:Fur family transcriptional regulator, ferric uptake regulator